MNLFKPNYNAIKYNQNFVSYSTSRRFLISIAFSLFIAISFIQKINIFIYIKQA